MRFLEAIGVALRMIWAQKMKSIFSALGVFVGVMFLIAVVSVVEGINTYMTDKIAGQLLGINTFRLRQRPDFDIGTISAETRREWRRRPRITTDDAQAVIEGLTGPVIAAMESEGSATVEYEGRLVRNVDVTAASSELFAIRDLEISQGRPFTVQETRAGAPVVVIGHELARGLFGQLDPIGREVKIRDFPYTVVGVAAEQGNIFGMSLDKFGVVPAQSPVQRWVNPYHIIDALAVKAATVADMHDAIAQAEAVMRTRRQLRPAEPNDFELETGDAVLDFWNTIRRYMFTFFPGIVGISLVVGGIVIMNIMLMSVAERTSEIGLRKSLGASRQDILRQFLVESATLSTVGATFGVATGIGLASLVAATTFLPASVAPWSIALGVFLGAGVGIVAGVYPASRAARLDPVVALRSE